MDNRFTENDGALSIRIDRKTFKFCRQCGHRLQGVPKRLANHYESFHRGEEAAWLQSCDLPVKSCYTNFEAYLENPDTKLIKKPTIKCSGAG